MSGYDSALSIFSYVNFFRCNWAPHHSCALLPPNSVSHIPFPNTNTNTTDPMDTFSVCFPKLYNH